MNNVKNDNNLSIHNNIKPSYYMYLKQKEQKVKGLNKVDHVEVDENCEKVLNIECYKSESESHSQYSDDDSIDYEELHSELLNYSCW